MSFFVREMSVGKKMHANLLVISSSPAAFLKCHMCISIARRMLKYKFRFFKIKYLYLVLNNKNYGEIKIALINKLRKDNDC